MKKDIKFNIKLLVDGKEQVVEATSSVSELERSVRRANKVGDLSNQLQVFGRLSDLLSQATGSMSSLTSESRGFSDAMRKVNTIGGMSEEKLEAMKGKLTALSKVIPMTREQLSAGLMEVISADVAEAGWMPMLEASARSSAGAMADLGNVVNVTSTIVKNYGMAWEDAGKIQDKIQQTAVVGVTTFEEMAQALPSITGQAAQLGVTLDEMLGVMATLTGVTGNTSEVATQLGSVLTALTKETSEGQKMAAAMGISFNAASVRAAGGLRQFINELDKSVTAYAQKTGTLKESIYSKLFGRAEALRLMNGLTGEMSDKFGQNIERIKDSAGTIDDALGQVAQTSDAKLQLLKNKFVEIGDAIYNTIGDVQPYVEFTSQLGISIGSVVMLANSAKQLGMAAKVSALRIATASTAVGIWRGISAGAIATTNLLQAAFKGAAIGATTLKVAIRGLLITTGIGALIAGLGFIIEKFFNVCDDASESVEDLGEKVKTAGDLFEEQRTEALAPLLSGYNKLKAEWESLKSSQEKNAFIKANQHAFSQLGTSINSVGDAEAYFVTNTERVVSSFMARAEAAAAAAVAAEKLKEALAAEADAKRINKENREKYKAQTRTGRVGADLTMEALVDNGGISVTSRRQREAEARAKALRAEAQEYTAKGVEAGKRASDVMKPVKPGKAASAGKAAKGSKSGTVEKKDIALTGSIDWYEERLSELRKKINAAADEGAASVLQEEYNATAAALERKKIAIGIEEPEAVDVEVKTSREQLEETIEAAQRRFDDALTADAKVEALADLKALQQELDVMTQGKLTIAAEVEPEYVETGSDADKRISRANAENIGGRIQQDYEIGLIGYDEALRQLDELNKQLVSLGLKPVVVPVQTEAADKAKERFDLVTESVAQMGGSFSQLGQQLEMPELNVAGVMAQAIATMVMGFAESQKLAGKLGPIAWMGFAATGLAQLVAMISAVKSATAFANGGIVSGPTLGLVGEYAGARSNPEVIAPLSKLKELIEPQGERVSAVGGGVRFEIEGRKLVGILRNEGRILH